MSTITRRQALTGAAVIAAAPVTAVANPLSRIEQLFAELLSVKQELATTDAWLRDDEEELYRLQSREDGLLARIAVHRATCTNDIIRKVQAWALVYSINPDDIREHGPSEDFPEPACTRIIASILDDTMKLKGAPLHGLTYPRRRLPNWKRECA